MYFMDIPIVYPQKWIWAAMLMFIGFSGFFAQVGEASLDDFADLNASDRR